MGRVSRKLRWSSTLRLFLRRFLLVVVSTSLALPFVARLISSWSLSLLPSTLDRSMTSASVSSCTDFGRLVRLFGTCQDAPTSFAATQRVRDFLRFAAELLGGLGIIAIVNSDHELRVNLSELEYFSPDIVSVGHHQPHQESSDVRSNGENLSENTMTSEGNPGELRGIPCRKRVPGMHRRR